VTYQRPNVDRLKEQVPGQLRELPVWLLWKEVPSEDGSKPAKVPYYTNGKCRGGTLDSPEDRKKLAAFDAALARYDEKRYAGLGVALGRVDTNLILSGIDLDECVLQRKFTGDIDARKVIDAGQGAYTEISPSKTGVKLFGTGDIGTTTPKQSQTGKLEIYSGGRFFTVTGERIDGDQLADLTAAAALARELDRTMAGAKGSNTSDFAQRGRNCRLTSAAGRLRGRDAPEDQGLAELRAINATFPNPLPDRDVVRILKSVWRYPPGYALTDLGNARRLVDRFGEDIRYVPESEKLLIWQGTHWGWDRDGEGERRTKDTVRAIFDEARDCKSDEYRKKLAAWALTSQGAGRIEAALRLARTEEGIPVKPEQLDADPMLFGVGNGVVDLRTGQLRSARREDYIVMRTTVPLDPKAEAPRWQKFLEEIAPDEQLRTYLQVCAGYCLTGDVSEQCLFLAYGCGANGKSTFLNTLRRAVGDYGTVVDTSTWMVKNKHHDRPPNDLAALRGKRLVLSPESEAGQRFAESLIKQVSGGDTIRARFLYAEFFDFDPQFKVFISANHKPVIHGDDLAIWRRIRLLPFVTTIADENKDKHLEKKLQRELPGILAWAVEGCLLWQKDGLMTPDCVENATKEYRSEMDTFGNFLGECCVLGSQHKVGAKQLYLRYQQWVAEQGIEHAWSQQMFGRRLADRGVTKQRTMTGYIYQGVNIGVELSEVEQLEADAAMAAARGRRA
jgi:P4 family phage/plasmid primase-like protien